MSDHNHKSITILSFALLGFALFQMSQVFIDRDNLHKAEVQVKKNMEQADKVLAENQKMLDQLNAIAIGTQRLADAGNANAKEIVQQLGRLGIKINPNFKAGEKQPEAPAGALPPAEAGAQPVPPAPPAGAPPVPAAAPPAAPMPPK